MKVIAIRSFHTNASFEKKTVKTTAGDEITVDQFKGRTTYEKNKVYEVSAEEFAKNKQYGLREATEAEIKAAEAAETADAPVVGGKKAKKGEE